jgi:hypothetical protein
MTKEPDNFDEPDIRQPVADVDVYIELSQLSGTVKYIADELNQLDQIGRGLGELGYSVSELRSVLQGIQFTASALLRGLMAMVGTLRHWF